MEEAASVAQYEACGEARHLGGDEAARLETCQIRLGEGKGRLIISSSEMQDALGTLKVDVVNAEGLSVQTFEETVTARFSYPYLEDMTGDGLADLMVPLVSGMVNTGYALWLQQADGQFARAGEIGGFDIGVGEDGIIGATGRSSAVAWETSYFRIEDGELKEIAAVVNRASPAEGEAPHNGPLCEVIRAEEGLDISEFCRE